MTIMEITKVISEGKSRTKGMTRQVVVHYVMGKRKGKLFYSSETFHEMFKDGKWCHKVRIKIDKGGKVNDQRKKTSKGNKSQFKRN